MAALTFPHGSPQGYRDGCRSKGGCPHAGSNTYLTCVEAHTRRQGDFAAAKLPVAQPLPRRATVARSSREADSAGSVHGQDEEHLPQRARHGTTWRYRMGCQKDVLCPNWHQGRTTCAEARRRYARQWRLSRLAAGRLDHGTSNGYLLGCREGCPADASGRTCSQARLEYLKEWSDSVGRRATVSLVDRDAAVDIVREFVRQGMSLREIARRSGCGRSTVTLLAGERPPLNVTSDTFTRLSALAQEHETGATR